MRKILIIIIALALLVGGNYLNARYINPTDYKVTYLDIEDSDIPESFKGVSVIFISDLEFGTFFTQERLDNFIEYLNSLGADFVIFGGDLFDIEYNAVTEDITLLTASLKSIQAAYGKFAILGDFDQLTPQRAVLVSKVLFDADFEMLNGNPVMLHHDSSEFINLIGFDYMEEISDLTTAYGNVNTEHYTLTVVHGGEFSRYIPLNTSNLTLTGHSHHLQINLPMMVDYEAYPHTGKYGTGSYNVNGTRLYISRGIGTTGSDYRLFDDPEILFIRFK